MITPLRLAVLPLLATALCSQTFIVDASSGPGTNFSSLAAAVASPTVPDGATLIVRPGSYNSFATSKGLTILGEPGVVVQGIGAPIAFSGLGPQQRVVLRGLQIANLMVGISFASCQGPVHIEDCGEFVYPSTLSIQNCSQVSCVRVAFHRFSQFTQSNVTCVASLFQGGGLSGLPALSITGGKTQFVNCALTGGSVDPTYMNPPTPAIQMSNGMVRLLGTCAVNGGESGAAPAISGTGAVRATPTTTFVGAVVPVVAIDEAAMSSTAATLGGTVTGTLQGSANLFGGIVFGLPRPPMTFAGIAEELWVEPLGFVISGQLAAPLTYWLDVPNAPFLRGFTFGWQGVSFSATAETVLSNAAWFCVN